MDADQKRRKSRIAALGLAIELIALYRVTKIFRQLRAARKQGDDRGTARPPMKSDVDASSSRPGTLRPDQPWGWLHGPTNGQPACRLVHGIRSIRIHGASVAAAGPSWLAQAAGTCKAPLRGFSGPAAVPDPAPRRRPH